MGGPLMELLSADDGAGALWQFHAFALATVLSGSAGVRATLPLFLISLFHLISPESVPLSPETEWLGYWFICVSLLVLLVIEILADLIPAVDHALHTILTPIHPIAGAVAAAAPDYGGGYATHVPMAVVGAALALSAHGGKSVFRATATSTTGGALNPLASICGTVGTTIAILLSTFVAVLSIILAMVVVGLCIYSLRSLRRARERFDVRRAGLVAVAAARFRRGGQQAEQQHGQEMRPPEVIISAAEPVEARAQPLVAPVFTGHAMAEASDIA
eukprot:CAMPEP_0171205214 /NCGR_PEP_ID=MMETSP0790-20130122/26435_1 /TAXON_ID=2925 /ORGANISM="Alexandrium catenella, Strain OF101" /LENGTH=273 /DNA_ID=CAMNT_0011670727 /DNA_START=61 /DNA_END=882 /DNA_ORIENTATION=-